MLDDLQGYRGQTERLLTRCLASQIPATAMCSVILLNRVLTTQAWASLFVLTSGVVRVTRLHLVNAC